MATSIRDLDPEDPGYDAAVEAALLEEDEQDGRAEARSATSQEQGDDTQQGAAGDEPKGDEPPADAGAAQQPEAGKPKPTAVGVLGKDGKTVLSYSVLKGAREDARQNRIAREAAERKAAALEQEIADLKAGKKPAGEEEDPLDEVLTDYPSVKPLVDEVRELRKQARAAPAADKAQEQSDDPAVQAQRDAQEAIDTVPLLAEWQHTDPEKWARAIEHDRVLQRSPKWTNKPLTERFAHVAKLVADEYDVPYEEPEQTPEPTPKPTPQQQQQPSRTRQDPKAVVQGAKRTAPNTLSDFKGGAPDSSADPIDRLPATRQVGKFMDMSDEDIDAYLARLG